MHRCYKIGLLLIGLLLVGSEAATAQSGTCSAGSFTGAACTVDEDCNVCEIPTIPGVSCSDFACPVTDQVCAGGAGDGTSCDGSGAITCVFGGGTCVGGTPSACETSSTCVTTALPVELASFDAVVQGSSVMLGWSTASETDNAGFSIEQATAVSAVDWSAWEELEFVEGLSGTTSETQAYQYRVKDLAVGSSGQPQFKDLAQSLGAADSSGFQDVTVSAGFDPAVRHARISRSVVPRLFQAWARMPRRTPTKKSSNSNLEYLKYALL